MRTILFSSITTIILVMIMVLFPACNKKTEVTGERAPLESVIKIHDPVAIYTFRTSTWKYALVKDEEYHLSYSFDAYWEYEKYKLKMEICLPDEIPVVNGTASWEGEDDHMTFDVTIKPLETGEYIITGKVYNADNSTDGVYHSLKAYVGKTASEAKNLLPKPKNPQDIDIIDVTTTEPPVESETIASEKTRINQPQVTKDTLDTLVQGNNTFAFNLYHTINHSEDNLLFSPYSISMALAMTYAGARGQTEQEMAEILHYLLPQSELHAAFNSLDSALSNRGKGASGKDGGPFRLTIANATWGQKDYPFQPEFLDILAEQYGAGLKKLDFTDNAENAVKEINDWVNDETEGRIQDIVDSFDTSTRLVITNAIYFNATWKYPFEKNQTANQPFHLLNRETISVPTMSQTKTFRYAEGENFQAIELPYDGDELSMILLLPDAGQFETYADNVDYQFIQSLVSQLKMENVHIAMPKFEYQYEVDIKEILMDMGMSSAFTEEADFSGMTGTKELHIDEIKHKACITVDETGTEAAAVSAAIIQVTEKIIQKTIILDHPFIFIIRDVETGTIMFTGQVLHP